MIACKENATLWNEAIDHDGATTRMKLLCNYLVHKKMISASLNTAGATNASQYSDDEDVDFSRGRNLKLSKEIGGTLKRVRSSSPTGSATSGASGSFAGEYEGYVPPDEALSTPTSEKNATPTKRHSTRGRTDLTVDEMKVLLSFLIIIFLLTFVASSGQRASLIGKTIHSYYQEQSRSSSSSSY